MILDARNIPDGQVLETDVCIIGAGAAGITLAREFRNKRFRVILLESGGFEPDAETQALYKGDIVGHAYYPLDGSRNRFFGGTTATWGGMCLPFDPIDFKERDWVPHSGWPLDLGQLEPYYRRAHEPCQIGPFEYRESYWTPRRGKEPLPINGDLILPQIAQFSPPTHFGHTYREDIQRAKSVTAYLYANALEIEADESGRTVQKVRVGTLDGGRFSVSAKYFVVAAHAIENARLLLLSRSVMADGLGNQHGLVGRYFMERVNCRSGVFVPVDAKAIAPFFEKDTLSECGINGFLGTSGDWQGEARVLNSSIHLHATPVRLREVEKRKDSLSDNGEDPRLSEEPDDDLAEHAWEVIKDLGDGAKAAWQKLWGGEANEEVVFDIWQDVEPAPNPNSRVMLSRKLDSFGQPKVMLDWQLTPTLEGNTIRSVLKLFAAEMGRLGLGRVQMDISEDGDAWAERVVGSFHHIGTTRMHRDERKGVVDENCRVHGLSNLYVAGSSVFPTGGQANPTLTLVALALRLGDRITEQLS
jgi:choline dehydrogenase-like flavoprotein